MGIIKTAIMSGAAIYGIKKISSAASERHANSAPAQQRREYRDDRDMQYDPAPYQLRPPTPAQESIYYDHYQSPPPPPQRQ